MNLVDELHAVAAALGAAGIPYAVCGGIAVTMYGATRTALPMTSDAGTDRERHVQRVSKMEGSQHLILDLILAEAAFAGLVDERVEVSLPHGPISVVSLEGLLRMKRLAARPQDLADIEQLERDDA